MQATLDLSGKGLSWASLPSNAVFRRAGCGSRTLWQRYWDGTVLCIDVDSFANKFLLVHESAFDTTGLFEVVHGTITLTF